MSKPTKAEAAFVARVVRLGCVCCRNNGLDTLDAPCEVHHLRVNNTGVALRSGWHRILGLCPPHHRQADGSAAWQGEIGYHVSPEEFELRYGTQEDLHRQTIRELGLNPADPKFQPALLGQGLTNVAT